MSISLCLSVMTEPPSNPDQEPLDTDSLPLSSNTQERNSIPRISAYRKLHLSQVSVSGPISHDCRKRALNYKMSVNAIPPTGAMEEGRNGHSSLSQRYRLAR